MPDKNWMTKELANRQHLNEEGIRYICGDAQDCVGAVSCLGCWKQKVSDWSWGRSYSIQGIPMSDKKYPVFLASPPLFTIDDVHEQLDHHIEELVALADKIEQVGIYPVQVIRETIESLRIYDVDIQGAWEI